LIFLPAVSPAWAASAGLTISPSSAQVIVAQQLQFSARGQGSNKVVWSVSGVVGGDAAVGTINPNGLYTAPNAPPSPATVSITAAYGTSLSPQATVTIISPSSLSVAVSPTLASVQVAQSLQFSAIVSGSPNTAVNWSVNGIVAGNSTVGTISNSG